MSKLFSRPLLWMGLSIALFVSFFYAPLINIPFTDPDQMNYFAELKGAKTFRDGLKFCDYAAARQYWKGDEVLYRPLLFVWLAAEHTLFNSHYAGWNAANLSLHLLVLTLLLLLLYEIQPSPYAAFFTLLFAVSGAALGLVRNNHLGGYLFGYAFLLLSLLFFFKMLNEKRWNSKILFYGYLISITVACFFYELAVPFSLILAGTAFRQRQKTETKSPPLGFFFLTPAILYGFFYAFRIPNTLRYFFVSNGAADDIMDFSNLRQTPAYAEYFIRTWVREIFPNSRLLKSLILGSFVISFWPALKAPKSAGQKTATCLMGVFIMTYTFLLAFLRNTFARDYHAYFFYLILTVMIYSFLSFKALSSRFKLLSCLFLFLLLMADCFSTQAKVKALVESTQPLEPYYSGINKFIDAHKSENGFSFSILNPDPDLDWLVELKKGYPDDPLPGEKIPTTEILYSAYYDKMSPKYALYWNLKTSAFETR